MSASPSLPPGGERSLLRGLQAAVAAYLLWGFLTIYWKQLEGFAAIELIGWRVAAAAIIMVSVSIATGRWHRMRAGLRQRSTRRAVLIATTLLTANWTTYVWAVTNDRVLETALGYFLAPLVTMALGVFVLGERLTPLKYASIALAVGAVVVMTWSYGRVPLVALVLGASWAAYGLTKRRVALDPIESLTAEVTVLAPLAVVVVVAASFDSDSVMQSATSAEFAFAIGTGIVTALPLLLFAVAAQRVPFTVLGPIQYLVPLINFGLGWVVFDEPLPPSGMVGFGLVWAALVLVTIDVIRGARRTSRPVRLGSATT